ncbi:MAG: hypothetical protein NUV53_04200 [Patescibacteria group bacterium]|nr:hypothetical protein [Patescibacteria group bacterium]
MKKIIVEKNEVTSAVAHRLLSTLDREVTLVIPKQSRIGSSLNNFHLLLREAETAEKKLTIESVDDEVLALAKSAGIVAVHPFLGHKHALQDIVPRNTEDDDGDFVEEESLKKKKVKVSSRGSVHVRRISKGRGKEDIIPEEKNTYEESEENESEEVKQEESYSRNERPPRAWNIKAIAWVSGIGVAVVLLGYGGIWVTGSFFGSATVMVRFDQTPWNYNGTIIADASVSKMDSTKQVLPAEIFSIDRNVTQLFIATGSKDVKDFAEGKLTIYNAYSSSPQILVATTRFATQDGKIFRLVERTEVPGAVVRGGIITPASITVNVVADQPGESYNVSPTSKLTIPAFKGTPRYEGFYGELPEGAKGGFVGLKKVPTVADVASAKTKTSEILRASLESLFATTIPQGFMVPSGSNSFTVKKLTVNEKTDTNGQFTVFGEATLSAAGFRSADLEALLLGYARENKKDFLVVFKSFSPQFSDVSFSSENRRVTFTVDTTTVLTPPFSPEEFRASILGLDVTRAQSSVSRIPGLKEGKLSLWPFWLHQVPADATKIIINIE